VGPPEVICRSPSSALKVITMSLIGFEAQSFLGLRLGLGLLLELELLGLLEAGLALLLGLLDLLLFGLALRLEEDERFLSLDGERDLLLTGGLLLR